MFGLGGGEVVEPLVGCGAALQALQRLGERIAEGREVAELVVQTGEVLKLADGAAVDVELLRSGGGALHPPLHTYLEQQRGHEHRYPGGLKLQVARPEGPEREEEQTAGKDRYHGRDVGGR